MSIMLDLISSVVIGSLVILIGLRLNATIAGTGDSSKAQLNVQENAVDVVRTLEYDFRRIAYNSSTPTQCILYFDTSDIQFQGDIDGSGGAVMDVGLDIVEWKLGDPVDGLQNPRIRNLMRRVAYDGGPWGDWMPVGLGVTVFHLAGYDRTGLPTNDRLLIRIIETTLQVENPYLTQDQVNQDSLSFSKIFWRQTWLTSENLKRHG
jgi:hypothetical protein